jgi:NADPH:quinone reductase-like Zn-dependent oxidoreductase
MRGLVIHRYGGPDVLSLEDRPAPEVGARDVLIDVKAASLNPLDFKIRAGKAKPVIRMPMPIPLGCDVAGTVARTGADVRELSVGDAVFARLEKLRMGGLAEQVAADASVVAKKPAKATFEEAAAAPLVGLTSLQALREVGDLKPGQRVLIHAGAGGVGSIAIQIAKILGLHVLTTTSTKNIDFVKSLGADEVIDYTTEKITERAAGVDAVFETLGGASEREALRLVKRGGVVLGIGGLPDMPFARKHLLPRMRPAVWMATLPRRRAAARAGVRFEYLFMRPDGAQLAEIATWIDEGRLRPVIHRTYPLDAVGEAFAELERGRARGKIVVTIPNES